MRSPRDARTTVDIARELPLREAAVTVDHALSRAVTTLPSSRLSCERQHRWPGDTEGPSAIAFGDPRAESALESYARLVFLDGGLPGSRTPGGVLGRISLAVASASTSGGQSSAPSGKQTVSRSTRQRHRANAADCSAGRSSATSNSLIAASSSFISAGRTRLSVPPIWSAGSAPPSTAAPAVPPPPHLARRRTTNNPPRRLASACHFVHGIRSFVRLSYGCHAQSRASVGRWAVWVGLRFWWSGTGRGLVTIDGWSGLCLP